MCLLLFIAYHSICVAVRGRLGGGLSSRLLPCRSRGSGDQMAQQAPLLAYICSLLLRGFQLCPHPALFVSPFGVRNTSKVKRELDMAVHVCHPSTQGWGRRIAINRTACLHMETLPFSLYPHPTPAPQMKEDKKRVVWRNTKLDTQIWSLCETALYLYNGVIFQLGFFESCFHLLWSPLLVITHKDALSSVTGFTEFCWTLRADWLGLLELTNTSKREWWHRPEAHGRPTWTA